MYNSVSLNPNCCRVCACGLGGLCLWGEAEQEKLERAAATQNMDRAFTWPCALWVRQVAASSTGPPTWATRCCYCRCRHRSVCCRWEACRHIHTYTHIHHFLHMDEYTPELQENVDTGTELRDKTIAVRDGGSCQGDIYQQTLTEPTVIFKPCRSTDPHTEKERQPWATQEHHIKINRSDVKCSFNIHVRILRQILLKPQH